MNNCIFSLSMSISAQIKEDMKQAMRDKNALALTAIRGVMSAFTNELVTMGRSPSDELSDAEVITVLKREVKRRKDAIEQFTAGGREDLADDDKVEVEVLSKYLPAAMSREQIVEIARAKIAELGVTDKSGLGQLTGAVMKATGGEADGNDVRSVLEELLA
jgi:uncharacterized protein